MWRTASLIGITTFVLTGATTAQATDLKPVFKAPPSTS